MILGALSTLNVGWADVDHVVLTHFHPDHVGSAGAVLDSAASATAYAGEADISQITSPRDLQAVGDGDEVFGLAVVETPGHTPGSISVFDADSGLLVAGDALTADGGGVAGPVPEFTEDLVEASASVTKLADLDVDTALVGHGDPVEGGAGAQIVELAASL